MTSDIFEINPNRLDEEWLQQPKLYHNAAIELADARKDLELAKAAVAVSHAETSMSVRIHPKLYGIEKEKPTLDDYSTAVALQQPYRKAIRAEIEARHKVELLQSMVVTLDHRKKALENLVDLRLANYYADPSPSKISSQDVDKWKQEKAFKIRDKKMDNSIAEESTVT